MFFSVHSTIPNEGVLVVNCCHFCMILTSVICMFCSTLQFSSLFARILFSVHSTIPSEITKDARGVLELIASRVFGISTKCLLTLPEI